jgi:hypothetical protein
MPAAHVVLEAQALGSGTINEIWWHHLPWFAQDIHTNRPKREGYVGFDFEGSI